MMRRSHNRLKGSLNPPRTPRKREVLIGNGMRSPADTTALERAIYIFLIRNEFTLRRRGNFDRDIALSIVPALQHILFPCSEYGVVACRCGARTRFCSPVPLRWTFSRTGNDRAGRTPKYRFRRKTSRPFRAFTDR